MERKGFIFDLDGVIVDTAKYHFLAWKKLANTLDIHFDHEQNEQLKGVSRVDSLKKILAWGNTSLSQERFDAYMAQKNADYLDYIAQMDESEVLPKIPEVLEELRQAGQGIALGSASKNARLILEQVNLLPFFEVLVDGNQVSKAKPDPEVFLLAAQQMGIAPSACVVFEDAVAGIRAANAAGMYSIGIGDAGILNEAREVFADFNAMPKDYIQSLIDPTVE